MHTLIIRHAAGNRAGKSVLIICQQVRVMVVTDKRELDENRRHSRVIQHIQPVLPWNCELDTPINRMQAVDNLALYCVGQRLTRSRSRVAVRFCAQCCGRIGRITVDRNKQICTAGICRISKVSVFDTIER